MSKNKKSSFSNAPSWYRKKQVSKYESRKRQTQAETLEFDRLCKMTEGILLGSVSK